MNDRDVIEILQMSGYAGYVWSAIGMTLLVLLTLGYSSRRKLCQAQLLHNQLIAEKVQLVSQLADTEIQQVIGNE